MIDPHAQSLEVTVGGIDLTIHQSPGLLTSGRSQGTTGAGTVTILKRRRSSMSSSLLTANIVLWQLSPLISNWIANSGPFFELGLLNSHSQVLELGCGGSGVLAMILAPRVHRYIATDQEYVLKTLRQNLDENSASVARCSASSRNRANKKKKNTTNRGTASLDSPNGQGRNVYVLPLDWELDAVDDLPRLLASGNTGADSQPGGFLNAIIACDCVYNEALVKPFVKTCARLCSLSAEIEGSPDVGSTFCLIAQQLRSPDVMQAWLSAMLPLFRVWRVTNSALPRELADGVSGFVVHLATLRV